MAQLVKRLLSARVMIPESWDWAPHWAPADRQLQMKKAVAVPKFETVEAQIEADLQLEAQLDQIEVEQRKDI